MVFDGKPVELLQDRCDVAAGGGSADETGGAALDQLKFVDGFVW